MHDQPKITQAMIDAYDEYTHLTLDRRAFMNRLTRLAGSGQLRPPSRPFWRQIPPARPWSQTMTNALKPKTSPIRVRAAR